MDHYVDIDVRPDPELLAHQLMSALYANLHHALAARFSKDIGVSFPGFKDLPVPYLGTRLRLHGGLTALSGLLASNWLNGIRDHVVLTPALPVPGATQYRTVRRVQVKSSPERLRRRLMRRHAIDAQTARQRIPDDAAQLTHLPFMQLRSMSTGQTFRLFIDHSLPQLNAVSGDFNAYGLSQEATIPWF